jgi:heme oxygenase
MEPSAVAGVFEGHAAFAGDIWASRDIFMPAGAASTNSSAPQRRSATPSGLRSRLKQATAEAHRDLDSRLGALDLSSLGGYRRFLEANAAALLPLEDALESADVAAMFADWPQRSRRAAIAADLAKVGGIARPAAAPPILNGNAVLGTMYVLEGSRLGANYPIRTVANSADPVIADATAYLGHGAGQPLWPRFLVALEREPVMPDDEAEIVEAATAAFATFAQAAARA